MLSPRSSFRPPRLRPAECCSAGSTNRHELASAEVYDAATGRRHPGNACLTSAAPMSRFVRPASTALNVIAAGTADGKPSIQQKFFATSEIDSGQNTGANFAIGTLAPPPLCAPPALAGCRRARTKPRLNLLISCTRGILVYRFAARRCFCGRTLLGLHP
jgi:hypothetical protein